MFEADALCPRLRSKCESSSRKNTDVSRATLVVVLSPKLRRITIACACVAMSGLLAAIGADVWVGRQASTFCHDTVDRVCDAPVALVLGCSERLADGRPNLYFRRRIEAAADLYRAGKIQAFIVSGDNHSHECDEPTAMKTALVARGVPENRIYCDFAGFRTLDSVIRAERVFGQRQFVIVSQRFHAERAVYLARQRGIEAFALCAQGVDGVASIRARTREMLARAAAVLDTELLATEPRFLGPRVDVVVTADLGVDR